MGDRAALESFIRSSQADLWRFIAHCVPANAIDDVVQETYIRALRALPAFQAASSARTWLLAIGRRAAADMHRSIARRTRLQQRLERQPAQVAALPEHISIESSELLQLLDQDRRDAFILTQLMGCTYEEAATICDTELGTIRSRVARARTQLLHAWGATGTQ
jgi:RNA polymerase sigma-70 factor (ECF subfamily)